MTAFVADLEALDALVQRMAAFGSAVDGVLSDLDTEAQRLRGCWSGAAASAQAAAQRRWTEGADEMRRAVASMHRLLLTAHGNYLAAADTNRTMWAF